MEDLLEQANEIQESLGRSYAVPDEIDEADLEAGEFCSKFAILVFINHIFRIGCTWFRRGGNPFILDRHERSARFPR